MIIVFVYTQLNVKTILFQTIQLGVSTVSMSNIFITNNFVLLKYAVQVSKQFYFKEFSLS